MRSYTNIDHLIALMFATSRLIREHMKSPKHADSSTFLRMGTLHYISEKGRPTMREVSRFLCITPPSVTPLINGLIQLGMITRVPDDSDRRVIRLAITAKGKRTLEKVIKDMSLRLRQVLEKLGPSDIKHLTTIMQKLYKAYSQ